MGLAIGSSAGNTDASFTIGPMGEVILKKDIAIGTEFNIFTATGTPVEWANYFKYYFIVPGSKIRPYADGGFGLVFATGGPFFDIRFGGGAAFPIANHLFMPADLQLGPVFVTGNTVFTIQFRTGIRYEIYLLGFNSVSTQGIYLVR